MQFESNIFIHEKEVPWEPLEDGVKRKILGFNDKIMLVKVTFQKGSIGALHHHEHSQSSYVEAGSFEVTIDGKQQILKSGDSFYVPPNKEHGVLALEDGILIDAFSPVREDFLH